MKVLRRCYGCRKEATEFHFVGWAGTVMQFCIPCYKEWRKTHRGVK